MTPEIRAARDQYERSDNYHQQVRDELARAPKWRWLYRRRLLKAKGKAFQAVSWNLATLLELLSEYFKEQEQADGR